MKAHRIVAYMVYASLVAMPIVIAESDPLHYRPASHWFYHPQVETFDPQLEAFSFEELDQDIEPAVFEELPVFEDVLGAHIFSGDDAAQIASELSADQEAKKKERKRRKRKMQKRLLHVAAEACLFLLERLFSGDKNAQSTKSLDFTTAEMISQLTTALHITDEYYRLGKDAPYSDHVLYPYYADALACFADIYESDADVRSAAIGTSLEGYMQLSRDQREVWIDRTIDNADEAMCLYDVFCALAPRLPVDIVTSALREITRSLHMKTKAPNTFQQFIYTNPVGKAVRGLFSGTWFSMLAGAYADTRLSRTHIGNFVKKYGIDMEEATRPQEDYRTFNQFFTRKLKDGARPVAAGSDVLVAPADGHMLLIDHISKKTIFGVKKHSFTLEKFLGNKKLAAEYEGGTMLIFRLAPWDYHRYHFPVDATPHKWKRIKGNYESVHPIAYASGVQPLSQNERHLIELESETFGDMIVVPVGAICVGRIKETYKSGTPYKKGDEMGYFAFGGSTVVMLFKPGVVDVDEHIVQHSRRGNEIPVKMGEAIGRRT